MPNDSTDFGMFLPTTQVWDVANIKEMDVKSPEFKELIIRLYQNINNFAQVTNKKDSAIYDTSEFVTGQVYFPDPLLSSSSPVTPVQRQTYRKVIDFGALLNTANKNVPHGITIDANTSFTRIYGATTNPAAVHPNPFSLPLPFASPVAADCISLWVNGNDVNVTTGNDRTMFTKTYIVLEYLKT